MTTNSHQREPDPLSCETLYQRILEDTRDMLDFVRGEGKTVPPELRRHVDELCFARRTDAGHPGDPTLEKGGIPAGTGQPSMALALEVHGGLSQLVAPATPQTIRASRSTGRWKLVADNITVKFLLAVSVSSLLIFLAIALWLADSGAKTAGTSTGSGSPPTSTSVRPAGTSKISGVTDGAVEIYMMVAAASLGSAFYGLYTAHKYLVRCTFDPKYHQVYLIRYVLGLTSGTILGFFGRDLLKGNSDISKQLGAAVLALIGGYAAEAVSQVLQRFAETLVTIVRGGNADLLQARQEEMKARARQQEIQTRSELLKGLLKAKETAVRAGAPAVDVGREIQKAIDSISP